MKNSLNMFYVIGSSPLIVPAEINIDFVYANEHGDIIKIVDIRNITVDDSVVPDGHMAIDYNIIQKSELVDSELITNLDEKLLSLFWKLTRNNASKTTPYEDDTN